MAAEPKPARSARHGTLWAYVQNWSARGITLVVFFALARLLTPAEFGTFAVTMVFLTFGEIFVEQLFAHAVVQREKLEPEHINSAFWATIACGLAMMVLTLAGAPFFARAFDSPEVAPLIMAMSPVFAFMALSSVPSALLRRSLQYKVLAQRAAVANLSSGMLAIAAALMGLGVWAFVLQLLCFHAVGTWILWRNEPWRPHRQFAFSAVRQLSGFSARITLIKLLDLLETRVVELVVGRQLGLVALGNYALAARAQQAAAQLLAAPLWESSIAVFARKQGAFDELRELLASRAFLAAVLILPVFLFAAASAPSLVPAVFGSKWHDVVPAFQVLCVLGALRGVLFLYGAMLQATGAASASLGIGIARTTVTLGVLPWLLKFGPAGVAACLLAGQLATVPLLFLAARRFLKISPWSIVSNVALPVGLAIAASVLGRYAGSYFENHLPMYQSAVLTLLVCAGTFLILSLLFMRKRLGRYAGFLPQKPRWIRVVGSFGERNFGDDLLMWGIVRRVESAKIKSRISIAVDSAVCTQYVKSSMNGHVIEKRFRPIQRGWDVEVLAGGGYFYSFPGPGSAGGNSSSRLARYRKVIQEDGFFHTALRIVSLRLRRPPKRLAIGIGVGPFQDGNEAASRRVLESMSRVWLRDAESFEYPRKWNLAADEGADICFGTDMVQLPEHSPVRETPQVVGCVVRGWSFSTEASGYHHALAQGLHALKKRGLEIRLFSFCHEVDKDAIAFFEREGFKADVWDPASGTASAYMRALAECDFFITSRFHGVVVAALLGRPSIGVPVDPKVVQVCNKLGLGDYIWPGSFSVDELERVTALMVSNWKSAIATVIDGRQREGVLADKMLAAAMAEIVD